MLLGVGPLAVRAAFGPTAEAGKFIRTLPRAECIVAYSTELPQGLVYYAGRRIDFYRRRDRHALAAMKDALATRGKLILVTDQRGLEEVGAFSRPTILTRHNGLVVVRLTPATYQSRNGAE